MIVISRERLSSATRPIVIYCAELSQISSNPWLMTCVVSRYANVM